MLSNKFYPIKGFECLYEISPIGEVKTLIKGVHIKKPFEANGYLKIHLRKDGKYHHRYIHRLVAENFIPNPQGKSEVNHINGDKKDNRICNLEWVTPLENQQHAKKSNIRQSKGVNITHGERIKIAEMRGVGKSINEIAIALSRSARGISKAISRGL